MNKKGFTLVELLAVIAIIGILSIVAVSTYNGVNNKSKQKAYENKISQIETSAAKWAKENNVNNHTVISVNKLVVEGYLQADETSENGLSVIKNPLNGENIICKTIDIKYKNNENTVKFNPDQNNCSLAEQASEDSKINIAIYKKDSDTNIFKGVGNEWTNQPITVVVNSDDYDNDAVSITYDFEGNSIEKNKSGLAKYTGKYLENVDSYYNAYSLDAEVMLNSELKITYKLNSGETKTRTINVRIDKEEATAEFITTSDWVTVDRDFVVKIDDGNGSGGKNYYFGQTDLSSAKKISLCNDLNCVYSKKTQVGEPGVYKIWTEDIAGNISKEPKGEIAINNVDKVKPNCKIEFLTSSNSNKPDGKSNWYLSDVTPRTTTSKAGLSGVYYGMVKQDDVPTYNNYVKNEEIGQISLPIQQETPSSGINYYCYTKSLAGIGGDKVKENVQVDKTRPTVTINETSDTEYKKERNISVTIKDNISGLPSTNTVQYSWSKSNTSPEGWKFITIKGSGKKDNHGDTSDLTGTINGKDFTGIYYLWIKDGTIEDIAGWKSQGANNATGDYVTGPYYFDNTPPSVPTVTFTNSEGIYSPGTWSKSNVLSKPSGSIDNADKTSGVGGIYYQYTTTGKTTNNTE